MLVPYPQAAEVVDQFINLLAELQISTPKNSAIEGELLSFVALLDAWKDPKGVEFEARLIREAAGAHDLCLRQARRARRASSGCSPTRAVHGMSRKPKPPGLSLRSAGFAKRWSTASAVGSHVHGAADTAPPTSKTRPGGSRCRRAFSQATCSLFVPELDRWHVRAARQRQRPRRRHRLRLVAAWSIENPHRDLPHDRRRDRHASQGHRLAAASQETGPAAFGWVR